VFVKVISTDSNGGELPGVEYDSEALFDWTLSTVTFSGVGTTKEEKKI